MIDFSSDGVKLSGLMDKLGRQDYPRNNAASRMGMSGQRRSAVDTIGYTCQSSRPKGAGGWGSSVVSLASIISHEDSMLGTCYSGSGPSDTPVASRTGSSMFNTKHV